MGFFRFGKKGKKLDLPPVPPAGELPSLEKEFPSLPEMPSAPPIQSEELPKPPKIGEGLLPPLEYPALEEVQPKAEEPYLEEMPELKPIAELKPIEPVAPPLKSEISGAPIYMEVEEYKAILEEVSSIKDSIRAADNALQKLNELKSSREREIGRWHARIEEIQRKLSFIDKSLFEER